MIRKWLLPGSVDIGMRSTAAQLQLLRSAFICTYWGSVPTTMCVNETFQERFSYRECRPCCVLHRHITMRVAKCARHVAQLRDYN